MGVGRRTDRFYFTPVCLLYRYLHLCLKSTQYFFGSLFLTPSKNILWVPTCSKILSTNSQILINLWLKRNIFTFFFVRHQNAREPQTLVLSWKTHFFVLNSTVFIDTVLRPTVIISLEYGNWIITVLGSHVSFDRKIWKRGEHLQVGVWKSHEDPVDTETQIFVNSVEFSMIVFRPRHLHPVSFSRGVLVSGWTLVLGIRLYFCSIFGTQFLSLGF